MFFFVADARDGAERDGCNSCCCEPMSARPGETNMVEVSYANWAAPIGGKGLGVGTEITVAALPLDKYQPATLPITIPPARITVDRRLYLLRFAVEVSPAAAVGDVYRLTIRQPALDCDCNKYWHEMCIDITIGKCG